jgi:hypothetical protein
MFLWEGSVEPLAAPAGMPVHIGVYRSPELAPVVALLPLAVAAWRPFAVSMAHKVFAFDWAPFDDDLAPVLLAALDADDGAELAEFIDHEWPRLTDPYEGEPLSADWRARLETGELQELADFALTQYYRVRENHGIGAAWLGLSGSLTPEQSAALLGAPFGVRGRLFDPGRLGSYFQSPATVGKSHAAIAGLAALEVEPYRALLAECASRRLGVYVTF